MKQTSKLLTVMATIAIISLALALTACGNNPDTHTHEWEWVETAPATPTAEGLETETCKTCGATNGTRPIAKLPNPNQTAITAFGKTATVIGDASIPAEDFNAAVGKLQEALSAADSEPLLSVGMRNGLTAMMGRTITIVTGNAAPESVNKALTVGVDYLKSSGMNTIATALVTLANNGAFVD